MCSVFIAACGLSLVAENRGYSSLLCVGFSLRWLLLLRSTGSRAQAQQLWHTGLIALWHVGSSQTRARIRVPCIGKQILNHCATREVPKLFIKNMYLVNLIGYMGAYTVILFIATYIFHTKKVLKKIFLDNFIKQSVK